ncbi:M48 family metallopeptidase [Tenacibaculum sp. IB213877]|uniref:M48 family metallopeptidase n=1 Tax=Tenacibaculum sp. IB213877 TaxID=3097351 RepID=UPI002A5A89B2|nr:M48 family metallopeptidase [Tenacibaculum sp. IB213877]MDY0781096.1 M48 family metallopeptidase [Tenacibaculum sp. IB213877]
MSFNANYFNGESSKTYKAIITPISLGWQIVYNDELKGQKEIHWKLDKIKKSEVYTSGLVTFTYNNTFPFQKIESTDKRFIEYINQSNHKNLNNKANSWLHTSQKKTIIAFLSIIIAFTIAIYFFIIPAITVNFAKNMPTESVVKLGNHVYRKISNELEIDYSKTKKLQSFVNSMKIDCEFPIKVYVSENEDTNAFAIPGGIIVVYTSLLEKIENEHQLAALITHEAAHVKNRHVLKNITRNLSGAIFTSVLWGDESKITKIIGENAHRVSLLSYSKKSEKEADMFGLETMLKNNLDLHGMAQLFEILEKETSIDVPLYFNNHPITKDRLQYVNEIVSKQKSFKENEKLKDEWLDLKHSFNDNEK